MLPWIPEPIEAFLNTITSSPENKHAHFRAIRALYIWYEKRHGTPVPTRLITIKAPLKKKREVLEIDQIREVLNLAMNQRDWGVLALIFETGMRASEVASAEKENIGLSTITVKGKTGEYTYDISPELRSRLVSLVPSGRLFRGPRGPLGRRGVYRIVRFHLARIGVTGDYVCPHMLRHTYGTQLVIHGVPAPIVQELMHHKRLETTQVYIDTARKHVEQSHFEASPFRLAMGLTGKGGNDGNGR